jgi:hypothetical protein
MHKAKKIKTTIVEKFKYDDYSISLDPTLLLKLLEFAHEEAKSDEQLHSIVSRAQTMSDECLGMDHYSKLITEPTAPEEPPVPPVEIVVETPVEVMSVE